MKKLNEKINKLSLIISAAAAAIAFIALILSIAAIVKSFRGRSITTAEYNCCDCDEYEDDVKDSDIQMF